MTAYSPYFNPGTGEEIEYLVTAAESDGELVRYRWRSVAGATIPEHVHPFQEERFAIDSGQPHFTLNGVETVGRPGETVVIPAGTWHSEWNPGTEDVSGIVELRPAMQSKELHEMFIENRLAGWGRDEIVKHMPASSSTNQIVEAMRRPM